MWVSSTEANYKVWFRVYALPGVTIEYVRAEIFNKDYEHPIWVGQWSIWEWITPYTYPNWAGAEWYPISSNEFNVTVVISVEKT